jgi:hypothetical protein
MHATIEAQAAGKAMFMARPFYGRVLSINKRLTSFYRCRPYAPDDGSAANCPALFAAVIGRSPTLA